MKKRVFLAAGVLVLALLLVCAWYLHASIYWKLGAAAMTEPSDFKEYTLGNATAPALTYAAIGDSLTAGVGVQTYTKSYPYLIAEKIAEGNKNVTLKPFAVPGVRTQYVIDNFIEPVIASKPDIITLLIGINDIHGNVPLSTFKAHYGEILSKLTQRTAAKIYVINLPYIGSPDLISLPYRYYFNWRTQQYNAIIKALSKQYDLTYIDLYTAHSPNELNDAYYAADFFHPNSLGYSLWAKYIYASFDK